LEDNLTEEEIRQKSTEFTLNQWKRIVNSACYIWKYKMHQNIAEKNFWKIKYDENSQIFTFTSSDETVRWFFENFLFYRRKSKK